MCAKTVIMAVLALLFCRGAEAQDVIPDVRLEVTVQQREEGKLERGLHLLELSCWSRQCSLASVSLNQCGESGQGKPAFFPRLQRSSTAEGNLSVQKIGDTLIVKETGSDIGGDYVNNFRFEYEPATKGALATRLIGFSGGFVKDSAILKKVLTVEYVPLPKRNQVVSLDCGALLPGVDRQ